MWTIQSRRPNKLGLPETELTQLPYMCEGHLLHVPREAYITLSLILKDALSIIDTLHFIPLTCVCLTKQGSW